MVIMYRNVTRVGLGLRIVGEMTGWLGSSVVVLARSAKDPGFEPLSSHNCSPVTEKYSTQLYNLINCKASIL